MCRSDDLPVSLPGSSQIIGAKIHRPACIWNHIVARRLARRRSSCTMAIVFLASLAYLAPSAGARASPGVAHPVTGAKRAKTAQYHGLRGRQYHRNGRSSGSDSGWLHESRSSNGELETITSLPVISRISASHSPRPMGNLLMSERLWFDTQIDGLNRSQIGSERSRDPRPMFQIGAALGLVYVGFLATWFWATRFRMRPPRDAYH